MGYASWYMCIVYQLQLSGRCAAAGHTLPTHGVSRVTGLIAWEGAQCPLAGNNKGLIIRLKNSLRHDNRATASRECRCHSCSALRATCCRQVLHHHLFDLHAKHCRVSIGVNSTELSVSNDKLRLKRFAVRKSFFRLANCCVDTTAVTQQLIEASLC